jgi:hypothetical protein
LPLTYSTTSRHSSNTSTSDVLPEPPGPVTAANFDLTSREKSLSDLKFLAQTRLSSKPGIEVRN